MPFCLVISSLHAEAAAGVSGSRFCVPVLFRRLAPAPLLCYTVCQINRKGGGVLQIEIKQEQQLSARQLQSLQVLQMSRIDLLR